MSPASSIDCLSHSAALITSSLFSDLARETSALVRTEIQLAKTEVIERINRFGSGLVLVIAGEVLLLGCTVRGADGCVVST